MKFHYFHKKMSSIAEEHSSGGEEEEAPHQEAVNDTPPQSGWNKSAGKAYDKKRGPQCNYTLYRGRNSGSQCPRNGFHEFNNKVYCTNHYRLVENRHEKLRNPKRKQVSSQQSMPREDFEEEEVMESYTPPAPVQDEPRSWPTSDEEEEEEPPTKKVRQLSYPEDETKVEKPMKEIERRAELKSMKERYKQKYQAKYQKPARAQTVWDTYRYKNPRKTLNHMFSAGGGVSSVFQLPHE